MKEKRIIEAILFASSKPIGIDEIKKVVSLDKKEIRKLIKDLMKDYKGSAIEIVEIEGKYAMQLRNEYIEYAKKFSPMEISKSLLKTLAIIAYHQPIKQSELKRIIGNKVYEHVKELKKRKFIRTKKEGRTKIIELSSYFYDYFGFEKEKIKEILYKRIEKAKF